MRSQQLECLASSLISALQVWGMGCLLVAAALIVHLSPKTDDVAVACSRLRFILPWLGLHEPSLCTGQDNISLHAHTSLPSAPDEHKAVSISAGCSIQGRSCQFCTCIRQPLTASKLQCLACRRRFRSLNTTRKLPLLVHFC